MRQGMKIATPKAICGTESQAHTAFRGGDGIAQTARTLLRRVFRILRGCGLTEAQLRSMSSEAVDEITQIPDSQPSRVTARQGLMCCDVVLKWRRDHRFLDTAGLPAQLSLEGIAPSFAELVEIAAPGADPNGLLATMEELGVVRITDPEKIELVSDSVVACSGQEGSSIASECVLEHICGFLGSVEYNVFDKPSRAKGRFERACYATVPRELVPVLQQLVSARGQDFVDVIDEWLARRAVKPNRDEGSLLVGAGAYIFVRENLTP
jgi:hypothetical protein